MEKKISDPETFARWLATQVEGVWEDTDGDEPFKPPFVALTRQLTGEKKWQVTIEWMQGATMRVVVD